MAETNSIVDEINKEIEETKNKIATDDLEIEITEEKEEPKEEKEVKEEQPKEPKEKPKDQEYGVKVQNRIRKLVAEKKSSDEKAQKLAQETANLKARLEKLEQGSQQQVASDFNKRYQETRQALHKAVEEGDTDAQVNFQEQLADMRATMRVAELQRQQMPQRVAQTQQEPQQPSRPTPTKAMAWWDKNNWFNAAGFEKETAAARAIDVQLDLEGYDKNSDEYYNLLNNRLQKMYPELISSEDVTPIRQRTKSSKVVAPSAGGSSYKGNRVRMTADQLRMARELGINDEAGLKKYAAEIQKSQRS